MTNWKKILETNPMFNLIIRKTVDEHPAMDIVVEVEINSSKLEGKVSLNPGADWYFDYEKTGFMFRGAKITWKYKLMRRSMTRCVFCEHIEWIIECATLNKIFVNNAFSKDSNQIVMESWNSEQ